tara:strand:+ start:3128 stop:3883 length:756 start_codon:yes stop_codon:yes gene_type:complete
MALQGSKRNKKKVKRFNRPTDERIRDDQSYKYTKGGDFTTRLGEEYIGEYHLRSDGKTYTGPTKPQGRIDNSIQLLPFYNSMDNFVYDKLHKFHTPIKDHTEPIPYTYNVRPSDGMYDLGFDTRYFVQRRGLGNYAIEINSTQRDRFGSDLGIDSNIYDYVDVLWQLTGTIEFIEATNKKRVNIASTTIPDITSLISNYIQFAIATNQTEFGDPESLLTRNKLTSGNKPTLKKTFDRQSGKIIPPEPLPPR